MFVYLKFVNKLFFLAFCVLLVLSACESTQKTMDSWLGSTKKDLIMSWGPPTRTADDGDSGEVLVYAKQIYIAPSTLYLSNGTSTTTQAKEFWDYKMFWINPDGKIYHWLSQRQQIPPSQIDLNIYHRN